MQKIVPNLWFDTEAEEAAEFYVSLFDDSKILEVVPYGEAGPGEPGTVMVVNFQLLGQEYVAINGGPQFPFTEAVSFEVRCDTQEEVDRLWDALTAGGEEVQCGWLKDRYGLSWQIVPARWADLPGDVHRRGRGRGPVAPAGPAPDRRRCDGDRGHGGRHAPPAADRRPAHVAVRPLARQLTARYEANSSQRPPTVYETISPSIAYCVCSHCCTCGSTLPPDRMTVAFDAGLPMLIPSPIASGAVAKEAHRRGSPDSDSTAHGQEAALGRIAAGESRRRQPCLSRTGNRG